MKEEADRLAREAEDKAKASVASDTAPLQANFDKQLEHTLDKAREEAVMAYRCNRGRAAEQATAYIDGGVYILGKISGAFPEHD